MNAFKNLSTARGTGPVGRVSVIGGLLSCALAASGAYAQGTGVPNDDSLTWKGITLYGIVDMGIQYDSHGAPISDYYPAGSSDIVQKDSNHSITGITPSNLSQSRVGLTGNEPLGFADWSGVFKLETFFNPQSGEISDALKSLTQNNGRALSNQTVNLDSSAAGQVFQQSYVGLASPTYGSLTWGRQQTLFADAVAKYDPQGASQAFSVIGLSGTSSGGGDTQDRRLDDSLKYVLTYHGVHVGALYKFSQAWGAADSAYQFQLGGEIAGLSADAYYLKTNDAVSAATLSAAQVAALPALGYSIDKSLAGTISNNTVWAISALYNFGAPKIYGGYEHISFANPSDALPVGFDDIGGYKLAFVNNDAYAIQKVLEVYWVGAKYTLNKLELTVAYYGYHQNSYAGAANAGCSSRVSGACSGTLDAYSFSAAYHFTKRFDGYTGLMYSGVYDGLANGYLNVATINPTIGARLKF